MSLWVECPTCQEESEYCLERDSDVRGAWLEPVLVDVKCPHIEELFPEMEFSAEMLQPSEDSYLI